MENLRGFEYKFNGSSGTITIKDLRFKKTVRIYYDYAFSLNHNVIKFLESKGIKTCFYVTDSNILLTRDFENQIK